MKFSYSWIHELVPGLDVDPTRLMRLITMKTAECEGVEDVRTAESSDSVIEVDNKSLTHRPDLWGHLGLAREVAAITKQRVRDPVNPDYLPKGIGPVKVEIADFKLCPRYSAAVLENVVVKPSPQWLRSRLEAVGINSINNIVDVTNYVMAELAQPMHAFDRDKLSGNTIFVRPARAGERIAALNDESYDLTASNLVIADGHGPIAIAGVIGGLESAIGAKTKRVVLESACFNASSVRKTSVALKLRTDASMRFEKSQDPLNTVRGLARAIDLLRAVSPGIQIVGGVADCATEFKWPPAIELRIDWLSRKLGREVAAAEVRDILESLEFGVRERAAGVFSVTIPSWRATKDISVKDDLLEEVGRMIGYDSIVPSAPLVKATVPPADPQRDYHRRIRTLMTDEGFTEVQNYSFLSEETVRACGLEPGEHVRVANPIASDQTLMRTSLLPGIWKNILENSKHLKTFRLFEIGREIHKRPAATELPDEIPHIAAAIYSSEGDGSAGLFELKRVAECLMQGCEMKPAKAQPFEHPERSAIVSGRGETIGRLFELHPSMGVEGRAAILDLDLRLMERLAQREKKYETLRRFPVSDFDLSVVMGLREPVGKLEKLLETAAGADLAGIEFVRQYTGTPLPPERKSVSYRLTVGAADHTLSSDEVTVIRNRIIEAVQAQGYELRI